MKFFKTQQGAAVVLAGAVAFGLLFGSHRSLNAEADKVTAQNGNVVNDLAVRRATANNLYTVACRYLPEEDELMGALRQDLATADEGNANDLSNLALSAQEVIKALGEKELSEQDARYVSGFRSQILSTQDTIARDPYTAAAKEFNESTLGSFPASVLGPLTGIKKLPVYQ